MKSLLTFFIISVALCQVFDVSAFGEYGKYEKVQPLFNVTVFYETLCLNNLGLYKELITIAKTPAISKLIHIEMVPFGKAKFTKHYWIFKCQHGQDECYGNMMNACFFAKNPDQLKQVKFVNCCMNDIYPPHAGERCAKKLGYNYTGVDECTHSMEGVNLQRRNGRKTNNFRAKIKSLPMVIVDNEVILSSIDDSAGGLKAAIVEKLKNRGAAL